jgi:hypothetical protein
MKLSPVGGEMKKFKTVAFCRPVKVSDISWEIDVPEEVIVLGDKAISAWIINNTEKLVQVSTWPDQYTLHGHVHPEDWDTWGVNIVPAINIVNTQTIEQVRIAKDAANSLVNFLFDIDSFIKSSDVLHCKAQAMWLTFCEEIKNRLAGENLEDLDVLLCGEEDYYYNGKKLPPEVAIGVAWRSSFAAKLYIFKDLEHGDE